LRGLGAVLVLWLISPTLSAFFLWQIIVSAINVILIAYFLWDKLPSGNRHPQFQHSYLARVWRFAAGLAGITLLSTILTQVDKIILSNVLPLNLFGYYVLGTFAQTIFNRLIAPIFSAVGPKFTELVAKNEEDAICLLYHKVSQFVSIIIYPAASIVIVFSYQLMLIWTQDAVTAENTYIIVGILACSMIFSCTMYIPYALQLAYGWTKMGLITICISVVVIAPLMVFMIGQYGLVGAALTHLILNCGYFFITTHFMHAYILPGEKWRWYLGDVCVPLLMALSTAGILKLLLDEDISQPQMILYILTSSISTLFVTAIATPVSRNLIYDKISRWRGN
jgi:O-antigen/teichoic acid export membrane protein